MDYELQPYKSEQEAVQDLVSTRGSPAARSPIKLGSIAPTECQNGYMLSAA
jgi:hypothetical protein